MNISVIGSGYVGLVTAVGFSSSGHNVICVDIDKNKVDTVNSGKSPLFEKNLEDSLSRSVEKGTLKATTDMEEAISQTEITFICVGTPSKEEGSIDLSYVKKATESVGSALSDKSSYHLVVFKSTIIPGTTEKMTTLLEKVSGKKAGIDFGVCMSPEFLREGAALEDFISPDRIIIGEYDKKAGDFLEKIFSNFDAPIFRTSLKNAETIKYVSNLFLAMKVSFANEIGNICKRLDVDVYEVMKGISMDKRISPHFLRAGCGFGGSCFRKDIRAFIDMSKKINYQPELIESVINLNEKQPLEMVDLLKKHTKLKGTKICVLGLAFKPDTDDMRDAPSIKIINCLLAEGAEVVAFDPKAMKNAEAIFRNRITYANSSSDAVSRSDYILIATEWDEFRNKNLYIDKVVIDGRKLDEAKSAKIYDGVGW